MSTLQKDTGKIACRGRAYTAPQVNLPADSDKVFCKYCLPAVLRI